MATITLIIPDAVAARVQAAFAQQYPDQTPKQVLARIIKDVVRHAEGPAKAPAAFAWRQNSPPTRLGSTCAAPAKAISPIEASASESPLSRK